MAKLPASQAGWLPEAMPTSIKKMKASSCGSALPRLRWHAGEGACCTRSAVVGERLCRSHYNVPNCATVLLSVRGQDDVDKAYSSAAVDMACCSGQVASLRMWW